MTYYAHSNELDRSQWQTIRDHLTNTSQLARKLGEDSGLSEFAYIAALLHDIGKYSQEFQNRLAGARNRVDHSTAGAQEVTKLLHSSPAQKLMGMMLAYCIAGHHSGLPDCGSEIDTEAGATLYARLKTKTNEYRDYAKEIDLSNLAAPAFIPIRPIKKYPGFSLAFFTRLVYSILVDADYLETESFLSGGRIPRGEYPKIEALCERLDLFLERFSNPTTPVNHKRTETLRACVSMASEKPGLYTLTVPTGGGKTLASLAFALHHALSHGMKRIIYAIPYTSIIDQNAGEFKKCLGEDVVLEHHSNFDWDARLRASEVEFYDDQTNEAMNKLKLASENWDIPVIVTTNVQFFESLFASRSSRCRKLHNLARSVIIFDEAQMLPRDYLKPCLFAVYELVRNYGATAIFCTATQPHLEQFFPEGTELRELSPDPQGLFSFYKRVRVENLGKLTDAELVQRMNANHQALCIVNTRKHARGLFEGLAGEGGFHLSTFMCPAHRKEKIREIKTRLAQGQPCRVVSTQIMEAGIDVDFPVGYRSISGLDSIIQAAGRVNREGKRAGGTLYVFEPDSAFVKRTPAYIQQGADVARSILRDFSDPVCPQAIQAYYRLLYSLQGKRAFDSKGILECFEKGIPNEANFDFKTAAENFQLIENTTVPVVIPYNQEAQNLLIQARTSSAPLYFSRKLQIYTVNIYEREFEALQGKGLIEAVAGTFSVLNNPGYYSPDTGLTIPESGGEAIFFDG